MTPPVIRRPGRYAVLDGVEHYALACGPDHVKVAGPHGPVHHPLDAVEDLRSVAVLAVWRGGRIALNPVDGSDTVGFYTNDSTLAERESLGGDLYNGWWGAARVAELTEVTERVTSIHPRTS